MDTWCLNASKLYDDNIAWVMNVGGDFMKPFNCSIDDLKIFKILDEHSSKICDKSYICGSIFDTNSFKQFKTKFDLCNYERSRFSYHATHGNIRARAVKIFVFGFLSVFHLSVCMSCERSLQLFA